MSTISLLLRTVHENVHVFNMKLNYSEPKIYTGGVTIAKWSTLSKSQQKQALDKDWYIYYSFRGPDSDTLKRQPNIKAGANKFKTKRERLSFLITLQRNLLLLLEAGFNPYEDNSELEKQFLNPERTLKVVHTEPKRTNNSVDVDQEEKLILIKDAFKLGLNTKQKVLNTTSYTKFKSRINRFQKWLIANDIKIGEPITIITKKTIIQYLNEVLNNTSARNRNNTRTDLGSLFQTLEDNDIIKENFVKKINVLKSIPKRNKTYTPSMQSNIYAYLKEKDPILLLFVQFISYNFLRPIEVCRLKINDIDIIDKKVYVRAKNRPVKIKIIPDILLTELPELSNLNNSHYLFTPTLIGGEWGISETNKRDYFTKRFKKIKDHFGLGKDYGLYSFRHTFITKLYREFVKTMSPFEAKSKLKLITGHSTMKALEQYLRDIDAELPEDYSIFLT